MSGHLSGSFKDSEPRILVGTLECGEAEFDACRDAIASQRGVRVEHFVVSSLAELDAHRELFQRWNSSRHRFDLFVKVDADTILRGKDALARLWSLFVLTEDLTGAQLALHDYFTNGPIAGLNCFSREVQFSMPKDEVYCDRVCETGHRRVLRTSETQALYPIADHCPRPHLLQAFHFGYRRLLKGQTEYLRSMLTAYESLGGEGRLWALAGARSAFLAPLTRTSYGDTNFAARYRGAEGEFRSGRLTSQRVVRDVRDLLVGRFGLRLRRLIGRVLPGSPR